MPSSPRRRSTGAPWPRTGRAMSTCRTPTTPAFRPWLTRMGPLSQGIGSAQREGMGLLEYQAMTYLRDVAHGGVLCTFSNISAPDRVKWCGPSGRQNGPSITYKITPCWVTLLQQARGTPCWASPLALSLNVSSNPPYPHTD